MKNPLPKKIMICRFGFLMVLLAHTLLVAGELVADGPGHRACKLLGYSALLGVVVFRGCKLIYCPQQRKRRIVDKKPPVQPLLPSDPPVQFEDRKPS